MKQKIFQIALVVEDYDAAIQFYCKKLNFKLIEDTVLNPEKRWVVVAPPGGEGCQLLLARASGEEQLSRVGNQTGGRVFLFMHTDDLDTDYQHLVSQGITIVRPPSSEPYGKVLVFADLYGNLWDLIEPISPD
jgi:catechol 2,3-dioxygenase-like lactoylglutathione lyase family enzyme